MMENTFFDRLRCFMPLIVALGTLLIGGCFMLLAIPGRIPDVWAHIYRIDGILNGDLLARPVSSKSMLHGGAGNVGGHVAWKWIEFSQQYYDGYDPNVVLPETITVQDSIGADVPYNNTATNTPFVYLPQLIGFVIGKFFNLPALITYRLAETIMLLVYAGCMAAGVALLPRWRVFVGLIMLCPLMLFRYSFAISADSMTQALTFLLSCMIFRTLYCRVSALYCIGIVAVCVAVSMCKFIYLPIVVLILFIPWNQRCLDKQSGFVNYSKQDGKTSISDSVLYDIRTWICCVGDALAIGWVLIWLKLTGWFVTTPMIVSYEEMSARKHALMTDPQAMIHALQSIGLSILEAKSNLDRPLDSLLIRIFWILFIVMLIILIAASVKQTQNREHVLFWWASVLVAGGIVHLTYLALWLQYTSSNAAVVEGMQYRYFVPLSVLCALCMFECVRGLVNKSAV